MQYHILISRTNPSIKVDLVRFCTIEDGQAKAFSVDDFRSFCVDCQFNRLLELITTSDISDSMYIYHSNIVDLVKCLVSAGPVSLDYFDNNLVIVFNHGTEKETPEEK